MIQGTAAVNAITCEIIQNYEELIEASEYDFSSVAVSLFPYEGKSESEVSFGDGEIIFVIKEDTAGWWEGEVNGNYGFFPSNYVKSILSLTQKETDKPVTPTPTASVECSAPKAAEQPKAVEPTTAKPASASGGESVQAGRTKSNTRGGGGGSKQKFMSDLENLKKLARSEADNNVKLQALVESLVKDVESLKSIPAPQSSGSSASLDSLQQEMASMRSQMDELSSSNAQLVSDLEGTNQSISATKKQLDALKTEEIALKRDLKILQFKCDKIPEGSTRRAAPTLNK